MPQVFYIGPIPIHLYGVIIMVGALIATALVAWQARRRGYDVEIAWDLLPWLLIGGIIGARIWHLLTPPASMVEQGITFTYYMTHPLDALAIWNGGLGIPGAVIGGTLALYLYCRRRKLNFGVWVDFVAPGLALAQAIGRWGNFVNQELYGAPTNLPWGIFIEPRFRLARYIEQAYYHPLFLYESLYNLANMAFLLWLGNRYQKRLKPGDIFLVYLIVYPVGRFLLELLRLDPSNVGGLNVNQTLMATIALVSTGLLVWRHRPQQSSEVIEPDIPAEGGKDPSITTESTGESVPPSPDTEVESTSLSDETQKM